MVTTLAAHCCSKGEQFYEYEIRVPQMGTCVLTSTFAHDNIRHTAHRVHLSDKHALNVNRKLAHTNEGILS